MGESTSSGFFSRLFDSASGRTTLVVGVAVGSSLLTAGTMYGLQRVSRRRKRADLADTIRRSASSSSSSSSSLTAEATATATTSTSAPRYLSTLAGARAKATEYDESLIREQLSRNYSFLGDEGMSVIRRSFVVVVGAGGVGSWAALMLIRSGVGKLRIIDFDQVSLSSLNRHACAALRDVGRPKVACCADAFAAIAPWATVEPVNELFRASEAERLLAGNPDYVVDAIDNIDTKVDLLTFCAARRIKVISSMGAGAKSDPSRVQISDISTTAEDPLARAVRRRLRALGIPPIPPKESHPAPAPAPAPAPVAAPTPKPRMHSRRTSSTSSLASGVYTTPLSSPPIAEAAEEAAAQAAEPPSPSPSPSAAEGEGEGEGEEEEERAHYTIPCVFSTEKSDTRLLPLDEAEVARGSVDELAALEDFRVRILPVLGPLPGMFGLAAATYVLCGLGGHALEPLAFKGRRKLYEKMHADLSVSEARSGRGQSIPFSVNDVAYLFEEVFRGRSVVPPHESLAGAQLQRWDSTLPLAYENVALFSRKQAKLHEREVLQLGRSPVEVWGEAAARTVRRRVAAGRISGFFR